MIILPHYEWYNYRRYQISNILEQLNLQYLLRSTEYFLLRLHYLSTTISLLLMMMISAWRVSFTSEFTARTLILLPVSLSENVWIITYYIDELINYQSLVSIVPLPTLLVWCVNRQHTPSHPYWGQYYRLIFCLILQLSLLVDNRLLHLSHILLIPLCCRPSIVWVLFPYLMTILKPRMPYEHLRLEHRLFVIHCVKHLKNSCFDLSCNWIILPYVSLNLFSMTFLQFLSSQTIWNYYFKLPYECQYSLIIITEYK
jgi:hypothetical protein